MKKNSIGLVLLLFALSGMFCLSFRQAAPAPARPLTSWKFDSSERFEEQMTTIQGTRVTMFNFTNTGKSPLQIKNAWPNCPCMSVEWSKEEIAPGKQGFVKVTYSPYKKGVFLETVTVEANVKLGSETLFLHYRVLR